MHHGIVRSGIGSIVIAGLLGFAGGTARANDDALRDHAYQLGLELEKWQMVDGVMVTRADDGCRSFIKMLSDGNAPPSISFVLEHDTPDLKAGKHPWTEGRAACEHMIAASEHRHQAEASASSIFEECKHGRVMSNGERSPEGYARGKDNYEMGLERGIPPTEIVKDKADGETGTLKAMYEKYCVPGLAQQHADDAARAAPYKKLLKNDKLRLALEETDFLMLAGGGKVTPQRLAATNLWFEDASPNKVCANGAQVHTLRRYQFDAQQKLAKVTNHDYCGRPPAAAFR
jgi:hypothetical protein